MNNLNKNIPNLKLLQNLAEHLWGTESWSQRSSELTPINITRYTGPLNSPKLTKHPFWEFIYIFKGTGKIYFEHSKHINIQSGTAVLVPPNYSHRESALKNVDIFWIGLLGNRLNDISTQTVIWKQQKNFGDMLEKLWLKAHAQNKKKKIGPQVDCMMGFILSEFISQAPENDIPATMEDAVEFLKKNFSRPIKFSYLSAKLGYSEGYFYRTFKKAYHKTPVQFLTEIRVQHALEMLYRTTWSFDKIARNVGFRDGLYLSRVMKKTFAKSPSELKKILSKEHNENE
ncbi:MAG: helix-turn-helix domain-containing protein [candidate division Zixibacteria bacterium]|nr:helix-turn-helix domain-containing protein [candidate division Zixibacteria bacterium]